MAPDDRYDQLPLSIRCNVTRREYEFMTDQQKDNIERDLTQPDPEPDF